MPTIIVSKIKKILDQLSIKQITIIFIVWAFCIYTNSLFNPFIGDDIPLIVKNYNVQSPTNIPGFFLHGVFPGQDNNYYRPIFSIILSLLYSFSLGNPFIFHVAQIMLHLANSILVYLVFSHFIKKPLAILLSLTFLTHPINTEAVIYISAFQEPLFALFGLLAIHTYLTKKSPSHWIAVLLTLSLLSKETGILFMLTILFLAIQHNQKHAINLTIQSLISLSIYLFLRFAIAGIYLPQHPISPIMTLNFFERLRHIPIITGTYLKTFIFPQHLIVSQSWIMREYAFSNFQLPLIVILSLLIFLYMIAKHMYKTNKYQFTTFLFFFIWFSASFAAHLHIIPLDLTVAERWFYIPSIGILGIIGSILLLLNESQQNKYAIPILLAITLIFSIRVINRNNDWHNPLTLYTHDIQHNPQSYQLHIGLGTEHAVQGKLDQAEIYYTNATQIFPSFISFSNLGAFHLKNGYFDKSANSFAQALHFDPHNTNTLIYLAVSKYKQGDTSTAIMLAQQANTQNSNQLTQGILADIIQGKDIKIQ